MSCGSKYKLLGLQEGAGGGVRTKVARSSGMTRQTIWKRNGRSCGGRYRGGGGRERERRKWRKGKRGLSTSNCDINFGL